MSETQWHLFAIVIEMGDRRELQRRRDEPENFEYAPMYLRMTYPIRPMTMQRGSTFTELQEFRQP